MRVGKGRFGRIAPRGVRCIGMAFLIPKIPIVVYVRRRSDAV